MSGRGPAALPQLTRRGVTWRDGESIDTLAAEFRRAHCVRLRSLLEPSLLAAVQRAIARGRFHDKVHGDAATELCLEADACVGLLHFLVNDPGIYRFVEAVAGCGPVRCFLGRVYRHAPGGGHFHDWHGDVTEARLLGMSLNLSTAVYQGGVFEIRETGGEQTLGSVANVGFGDAIVFRLGPGFEHRVTALHGPEPKTALAGWFRREPDYLEELRRAIAPRDPRA